MVDVITLLNKNALPIIQKVIAAADIGATYSLIGSSFESPMVCVIIVSTLDQPVQFSWDGTNDHIPILAGSAIILDLKSDNAPLPAQYAPYVKEIGNPTTGSLYVCGFTLAG